VWVFRSLAKRWFGASSSPRAARKPRRRPALPRSFLLAVESLEDRTLLSTIPAPVVQQLQQFLDSNPAYTYSPSPSNADPFGPNPDPTPNLGNIHNYFSSPTLAVDPGNANNIVAVYTHFNDQNGGLATVQIAFSTDGGTSWNTTDVDDQFSLGIASNARDPNRGFNGNPRNDAYQQVFDPSVAFGSGGSFYVVSVQASAGTANSTAVVVDRFNISNLLGFVDTPDAQSIVYQSNGQDPAANAVVVVDNNRGSFTDPATSATQTDPIVAANHSAAKPNGGDQVYVAWDVNYTDANINVGSPIMIAASDNANITDLTTINPSMDFSTPRFLDSSGNGSTSQRMGAPALVVSQGTITAGQGRSTAFGVADIPGGVLEAVYSVTNPNNNNNTSINHNSISNGGSGFNVPGSTSSFPGGSSVIRDAIVVNNNSVPTPTTFRLFAPATPPDGESAASFIISDLNVNLALVDPHLEQLSAVLTAPNGMSVTLFRNGVNSANQGTNAGLPAGANMGVLNGAAFGVGGPLRDSGAVVDTVFDQQAPRSIRGNPGTAAAPYTAHFRPEAGPPAFNNLSSFNGLTYEDVNTAPNPANDGIWTLTFTDFVNDGGQPTQFLVDWGMTFTSNLDNQGFDDTVAFSGNNSPAPARGGVSNPYPNQPGVSPNQGIGPSPSIAMDNTLGSFSPFQGRLYVAYTSLNPGGTPGDNTNVLLMTSDDGGATWSGPVKVSNDNPTQDGFSQGDRAQWMPVATVDQSTGTLFVQYNDARWDAARVRFTNYLSASIDGGQTFSEAFLNSPKQAVDAVQLAANGGNVNAATVTLEPIPNNPTIISPGNTAQTLYGFGDRQGLIAVDGHTYSVWSGNLNKNGANIIGSSATYAAGPRILSGDMGPVTTGPSAPDGTTELASFTVTFDRPVDVGSFTPNDVAMFYHSPTDPAVSLGTPVGIASVTPLNVGASFGPGTSAARLATQFLITLTTPQANVGTYSYIVGPHTAGGPIPTNDIHDDLPQVGFLTLATNSFDAASPQVPQTVTDSTTTNSTIPVSGIPAGQVVTGVTVSLNIQNYPFTGDLRVSLIAPDNTTVLLFNQRPSAFSGNPGNPGLGPITFDDAATASLASGFSPYAGTFRPEVPLKTFQGLSAAIANGTWRLQIQDLFPAPPGGDVGQLVSWSMTIKSGTLSTVIPGNFMDQNANGSAGEVWSIGGTTGDAFAAPTPTGSTPSPFQFPFDKNTLPLIIPGPHIVDTQAVAPAANLSATEKNLVLNTTVSAINVTFDRDMNPSSFTTGNILSIVGPIGPISGPFTVTALSSRTFQIGFPTQQLSGTYTVTVDGNMQAATKLPDNSPVAADENLNAGVDVLRNQVSPGTTSSTTTKSYFSTGASNSVTIPAANGSARGTVTTTIQVPDNFAIQQLTLQLSITYPNDPDLTATLTAPDGTKIQLFSGVGSAPPHANFANTIFSDSATTPIQKGNPPFNLGPYNPQFPLSVLNGHSSSGTWTLTVTNTGGSSGTVNNWSLNIVAPVPSTGLGEPVADQYTAHFRIWTQDPTLPQPHNVWTPAGGASLNGGGGSGRIGGIAVDPSDPSGNTVYIGGASGGIWKTSNFLTTDPAGPTYIPLTNFGPTFAINIGGIAVFGRNNDPRQSIVFAATGEGDISSQGVGLLRSLDGGNTWTLLDSTNNFDAFGNEVPEASRDHKFVGNSSYKVIVDPTPTPTGGVIVYVAMKGANGGVWRSTDTGNTWTLMRAGSATDVVLDQNSTDAAGNLDILFTAFANDGVYYNTSAPNSNFFNQMPGGGGTPLIQDSDFAVPRALQAANRPSPNVYSGNGATGRILLAAPFHTGNPAVDALHEGWLYAAVMNGNINGTAGSFDALYVTKDFGINWSRITFPSNGFSPGNGFSINAIPTNDTGKPVYNIGGGGSANQGNYDFSLVIDPTNPNVVYIGGTRDDQSNSLIRVDTSKVIDAHAFVAFDNQLPDGGLPQNQTSGGITIKNPTGNPPAGSFTTWGLLDSLGTPVDTTPYLNLTRDPGAPFVADSTLFSTRISGLSNQDTGVTWIGYDNFLGGSTDHHRVVSFVDPVTGQARFVWGDDQGVWTGVVDANGNPESGIGTAAAPGGSRNGNLQITQFYYGAAQPSILAAQVAGALLYGQAQDDGFPASGGTVLTDGIIGWNGGGGDGGGVATDQTGGGTLYQYNSPCCGGFNTSFFQVNGIGRTNGLILPGDNPDLNQGEWSDNSPPNANFALNPIDPKALVVSSNANPSGRIFRTTDQGQNWFVIGQPGNLDNTHANALAFGAPPLNNNGNLNDFIYAGTNGGRVFVTFSGGGGVGNQWTQLGAGPLDGTPVHYISADPVRGSHDAYAVTSRGVYFMADSTQVGATWQNITGNLFSITHTPFGDANLTETLLRNLTSLAVDWRYSIPDDPTQPNGPTHPLLYVGGEGGIFRSGDRGANWTIFPDSLPVTQVGPDGMPGDGAPADGGYLPVVHVSQLLLSVGNINPVTGQPDQSTGPNLLYAATFGQGGFIIRLPDNSAFNLGGAGPKVVSSAAVTATGATLPNAVNPAIGLDQIDLTFGGAVDPSTFDLNDVNVTGVPVQSLTSSGTTATVTTSAPHGYTNGQVILISGATPASYNGAYSITVTGPNTFTYRLASVASSATATGPITMLNATSVGVSSIFGSTANGVTTATVTLNAPLSVSSITLSGTTATVTTTGLPNGLNTGKLVTIAGATQAGYDGTFAITVTGPNTFTYQIPNPAGLVSPAASVGGITATPFETLLPGMPMTIMGAIDPAYDGTFRIKSVLGPNIFTYQLTTTPSSVFQTGNIIAATPITGFVDQTLLGTPFIVQSITRIGTTATVTTTGPHGFASGDTVTIAGASPGQFNGTFAIIVTGLNSFTYTVPSNIAASATGSITATLAGGPTAHNLWQVGLAHQSAYGSYNLVVGPNLTDYSGRAMDQDGEDNGGGTGDAADAFTGTFTIGGLQVINISPSIPVPVPTPPGLSAVSVTFNAPVDPNSFTPAQVKLVGPNGPVQISTVTDITGVPPGSTNQHTVWQIALPTAQLVAGNYTLTIGTTSAPFITDMGDFQGHSKQPLDQDEDGTLPPGTDDQFTATFTIGGLQVVSVTLPPGGGTDLNHTTTPQPALVPPGLSSATITFSRDTAPSTVNTNNVTLTRLDGAPIVGETLTLTDITVPPATGQNPHNVWLVSFSPALTTPGVYALDIGTGVTDSAQGHLQAPFRALFDVDGLAVTGVTPVNGGFVPPNASAVIVTFNQAIQAGTLLGNVTLNGPNGVVAPTGVKPLNSPATTWEVDFPNQPTYGTYTLNVGPGVLDLAGEPMNQNHNLFFGEAGVQPGGDAFQSTFQIQGLLVLQVDNELKVTGQPVLEPPGLSSATVTFNEPVGTFPAAQAVLTRPDGTTVVATSATSINAPANTKWAVTFPAQTTPGVYKLTVGPGVLDPGGNAMDQNLNNVFGQNGVVPAGDQYQALFDVDGLAVTGVTPAGVSPQQGPGLSSIAITFNQAVGGNLDNTTVKLTGPKGNVPATNFKSLNAALTQWEVDFAPQFTPGTYNLLIGPGVTDLAGKQMNQSHNLIFGEATDSFASSFTITGLRVTSVKPAVTSAVLAPPGLSSATITFNREVDPTSFTTGDLTLALPNGAFLPQAQLKLTDITPTPASGPNPHNVWEVDFLTNQTTPGVYTLTVGPNITDSSGTPMDQNQNLIFGEVGTGGNQGDQFVAQLDVDGLAVLSVTPSGIVPASLSQLTITFNQGVKKTSINPGTLTLTGPNGQILITGVTDLTTSTTGAHDVWRVDFAPQNTYGTYKLTVGTGVQDLAGNAMNQNQNSTFGEVPADQFNSTFTIDGLRIVSLEPSAPVAALSSATFTFNQPVNPSQFRATDLRLIGPDGTVIPIAALSDITPVPTTGDNPHNVWQVNFDQQTATGTYTLIVPPTPLDMAGRPLDQNDNGIPGEVPADNFNGQLVVGSPTPVTPPSGGGGGGGTSGSPNVVSGLDVTGLVQLQQGKMKVKGNNAVMTVSFINATSSVIQGPFALVIGNLPKGAKLVGATGFTLTQPPTGQPYVMLTFAGNQLNPGDGGIFKLKVRNKKHKPLHPTARLLAGFPVP
jgi:subtilisin-like proprotein convertase family protein